MPVWSERFDCLYGGVFLPVCVDLGSGGEVIQIYLQLCSAGIGPGLRFRPVCRLSTMALILGELFNDICKYCVLY